MIASKKVNLLDLTAGSVLAALILLIAGVIAYINLLGVMVTMRSVNPTSQISPYETLTLTFSQPVRPNDVENQLQVQPSVPVRLEWQDDHTVHVTPIRPYQGNLMVHLVPGRIGADGTWLRNGLTWTFTVRSPKIIYWNYADPQRELMVVPVKGGSPRQLTFTGGEIYDFAVSPSGDSIAYSVLNDQKGIDLWIIDRNGKEPRKLLDCGTGWCTTPAWSPDGKLIAYDYQAPGLTADSAPGAPRPWIVEFETGNKHPVFSDPQTIGYGALWSPDGNWLASYDGVSNKIRVVNLQSGKQVELPSTLGNLGSWSPDSEYLLFPNNVVNEDNTTITTLDRADFKSGEVGVFLGKPSDHEDYMYGSPAWSPSGDQIAVSLRPDPQNPERQLWVFRPETLGGPTIGTDAGFTYDYYQWDPWGTGLVLQQANLKKVFAPEAAVWFPMTGKTVIAEDAMFPHWLP